MNLHNTKRTTLRHLLLLAGLGLFFCQRQEHDNEILVSAGISLRPALEAIKNLYESQSPHRVQFNFASSGLLASQIRKGAPIDVFISSSQSLLNELNEQGRLLNSTHSLLAGNRLALLIPSSDIRANDPFEHLDSADRIAIGNPATVPAGYYARECLIKLGLWKRLFPQFVFTENARHTLDYTARGEVDAGITYATDAKILSDSVKLVAKAPKDCHPPIAYGIAVIKETTARDMALDFVKTATSLEAMKIFTDHGFNPPPIASHE